MRNFDAERAAHAEKDMGFIIGGESFRIRPGVHPDVFIEYEETPVTGQRDVIALMDKLIKAFLMTDDDRARWDKVVENVDDPITAGHRRAVVNLLYEVESELPTSAPEPSGRGRGRGRGTSSGGTSSPAGAES